MLKHFGAVHRQTVSVTNVVFAPLVRVIDLDVNAAKVAVNSRTFRHLPIFILRNIGEHYQLVHSDVVGLRIDCTLDAVMKRMHEGRANELLGEGDTDQVQQQKRGDPRANGSIDRRELLLLVVGERDRVRIPVELLYATLGPRTIPASIVVIHGKSDMF